jgi:hypothetical protein
MKAFLLTQLRGVERRAALDGEADPPDLVHPFTPLGEML